MRIKQHPNFNENLTCTEFYETFNKEYFRKDLGLKGTGKIRIPQALYRKIIFKYFEIYFKELYFIQKPMYFIFTGYLQIVKVKRNFFERNHNAKEYNLQIFWGKRGYSFLAVFVNILKSAGKTNSITKLEKLVLKNVALSNYCNFDKTFKSKLIDNDKRS